MLLVCSLYVPGMLMYLQHVTFAYTFCLYLLVDFCRFRAFFLQYALDVPCLFHACSMHVPCMLSACILHVPCMFLARSLHVPCTFLACSLHVPCVFLACSMHVPCMFLACSSMCRSRSKNWSRSRSLNGGGDSSSSNRLRRPQDSFHLPCMCLSSWFVLPWDPGTNSYSTNCILWWASLRVHDKTAVLAW